MKEINLVKIDDWTKSIITVALSGFYNFIIIRICSQNETNTGYRNSKGLPNQGLSNRGVIVELFL
jgi:hypothetical protein